MIQKSADEIEFERKREITCHWKYKYLSDMKVTKLYSFDPSIDLHEIYLKDKDNVGIRMYINADETYDSYLVPGINIIAGQTGHGKSMAANSIAYRAVRDGKNVLFISLEIPKKKVFYQMISIHSRNTDKESEYISHSDIKNHKLNTAQEEHVFNELWNDFNNLKGNLYVIDEWDFDSNNIESLQEIMFLIEEYAQTHTEKGLDMIVIDYIQLLKTYGDIRNEYEALSKWVNDLRKMSTNFLGQNHEIIMVLLSQLNRDAMANVTEIAKKKAKNSVLPTNKQKNIPDITIGLSQIAGSVEICKAASTIYAIYSDDSFRSSEQCLIFLLKNRDGASYDSGKVTNMHPKYYCFGNFSQWDIGFVGDPSLLGLDNQNILDASNFNTPFL